ncbi:hypothetical protein PCASD_21614 [Puccinia coronata f. sp. avenae]|uniref:Uncharacterized protein n=1 Tax=Puccinia coronata f. sp. avenae TaxID=200324 RepID=A0A2N5SD76_9BASI|nr:hypothetical protein PCASD_21614 [Puccinia coronata f. sp. avenae]
MALEPLLAQAIRILMSVPREQLPGTYEYSVPLQLSGYGIDNVSIRVIFSVTAPPAPPVEPREPRINWDPKSKKELFVSLEARTVYRSNSPFSQQRTPVMKPQRHHRVWTLIYREPDDTGITQGRGTPPRRTIADVSPVLGRRTERDDDENEDHEDARPTNRLRVA